MNASALSPSPVVRSGDDVLSLRHGVSWLLLAAAAGAVNGGAFLACERFVTHVTGTVTRIGVDVLQELLMLEYALVLGSFIAGAMASVLAVHARVARGKPPAPHVSLGVVAAVLVLAGTAGQLEVFGPIGGTVEEPADFAFLCVIAFAMGLMNATVAATTAYAVRTTHMTGPATDFGVHLATAWLADGEERRTALRLAALRGGKIVAFILGAALMIPVVSALGYSAFAVPAALVSTAAVRSFFPETRVNDAVPTT